VNQIILDTHLNGIRFWALHYLYRSPKIEVYRYVGYEPNTGRYFFQSVRNKSILHRNHYQLNESNFKPFLLNTALLKEEERKAANANI
jgi:hypothetical protein